MFFFSVCPSKGGQIWCCQKDDEIFFQFQMSLAFLKGAEVYHFCWLPGFGLEQFFGKGSEPKKLGYGILFLLEKMDLEPSYVSFFAEFFFGVFAFFCRGNIMSVDIS